MLREDVNYFIIVPLKSDSGVVKQGVQLGRVTSKCQGCDIFKRREGAGKSADSGNPIISNSRWAFHYVRMPTLLTIDRRMCTTS